MSAVPDLREALARRFPDAQPLVYRTAVGVATGIVELDRMLPGGGLPRGGLTVWKPGGGATAVLRSACDAVVRQGERSAWVDGSGLIAGEHWSRGPLLVKPAGAVEALECTEELARSGGFGLVVLGWTKPTGALAVRLSRAVRAGGGALVVVTTDGSQAQLRLESRLETDRLQWRRGVFGELAEVESVQLSVSAGALGWSGRTEFSLPVLGYRLRSGLDPLLVDRRGAPRRAVWPAGSKRVKG
jgi:hypothetical protein